MALNATALEEDILAAIKKLTPELRPDEVLRSNVAIGTKPDGSPDVQTTQVRGPVVIDDEGIKALTPLVRAIAKSVVDHLTKRASVDISTGRVS